MPNSDQPGFMSYNPGVTFQGGQLMAQGISKGADSLADGIKDYMRNKQARAGAEGQIQGILASNPDIMSQLGQDPNAAPLMKKLQGGNANLADTQQLLGIATTVNAQKQMKIQQANDAARTQAIVADSTAQAGQRTSATQNTAQANATADQKLQIAQAVMGGKDPSTLGIPPQAAQDAMSFASSPAGKFRASGGSLDSATLERFMQSSATTDQKVAAASSRAQTAEDKLSNSKGNFTSIDDASDKLLDLKKKGIQNAAIVTKPQGTYDIEVRPPQNYAPDPSAKVQGALDSANEELAAATDTKNPTLIANAQAKVAMFKQRLQKISSPTAGGLAQFMGNGGMPQLPAASSPGAPLPAAVAGQPATAAGSKSPSPQAIAFLKQNPKTAAEFDGYFGTGASQAILGQQ